MSVQHTGKTVALILGLGVSSFIHAAPKPNVIIIVTDDHGYADLGAYQLVEDIRTPHLDELAKGGVLATRGYATAPQCVPSRGAIATGRYQTRFGLEENPYSPMRLGEVTIAERLRDVGYATGFVGKWHLEPTRESRLWMETHFPTGLKDKQPKFPEKVIAPYLTAERGYTDYFEGYMSHYRCNYDLKGESKKSSQVRYGGEFRVDTQTQAALAFIKRRHNEPFFLHLNYYAPHVPAQKVKKHFSRFPGEMAERRRWALASIAAIDDGVGEIMKLLQTYEIEENTIVFFFSDNGAPLKLTMEDVPFKERGWNGSLNGDLVGEKGMLTDGGVRVPYLVYWKGKLQPQQYDKPVSTMDAGATALALAGVQTKPGEIDGVNLLPYFSGAIQDDPHDALFWRFWGQSSVLSGKWKFMHLENGTRMLFDMYSDQHENTNLIDKYPEVATRLEKKLAAWRDQQHRSGFPREYGPQDARFFDHYFDFK